MILNKDGGDRREANCFVVNIQCASWKGGMWDLGDCYSAPRLNPSQNFSENRAARDSQKNSGLNDLGDGYINRTEERHRRSIALQRSRSAKFITA